VFMFLLCSDLQAGEDGRQQLTYGEAATMTMRLPLQDIRDNLRFAAARVAGELLNSSLQIGKQLVKRRPLLMMKRPQLLQNRTRFLETGMLQWLVARQAGEGQAAEPLGDLHAGGSLVDAPRLISASLATVVVTMVRQAVGNPHQRRTESPIGLPDDRSAVMVGLVALRA